MTRASVRATMHSALSARASTAAWIFCTIWSAGMTALPVKCPHFFGLTWSSSWIAAAPARSSVRTVRDRLDVVAQLAQSHQANIRGAKVSVRDPGAGHVDGVEARLRDHPGGQ